MKRISLVSALALSLAACAKAPAAPPPATAPAATAHEGAPAAVQTIRGELVVWVRSEGARVRRRGACVVVQLELLDLGNTHEIVSAFVGCRCGVRKLRERIAVGRVVSH